MRQSKTKKGEKRNKIVFPHTRHGITRPSTFLSTYHLPTSDSDLSPRRVKQRIKREQKETRLPRTTR